MSDKIPDDMMIIAWRISDRYTESFSEHQMADDIARAIMAERERVREEIERLRAALEPFADKIIAFEKAYQEYGHDFSVVADGLTTGVPIGDLRRARDTLEALK